MTRERLDRCRVASSDAARLEVGMADGRDDYDRVNTLRLAFFPGLPVLRHQLIQHDIGILHLLLRRILLVLTSHVRRRLLDDTTDLS